MAESTNETTPTEPQHLTTTVNEQLQSAPSSSTLLPSPVASFISLVTTSSSVYLRVGTFIGALAIDGARIGTLTGLELGRAVVEQILLKAGGDVVGRSSGEVGRRDAEGVLERSISMLHSTLTHASFLASTGFHIGSAALESTSMLSQHLLSALDAILGSTESSRAIAAIVTLIRREFKNPETGDRGERVGVMDLLVGMCGLALLQQWAYRRVELDAREKGAEEAVWDVVILNDGTRADVVGVRRDETPNDKRIEPSRSDNAHSTPRKTQRPSSFISTQGSPDVFEVVKRGDLTLAGGGQDMETTWSEAELRHRIMEQLPPSADISITTETVMTKTITVEITGADPPEILPPPGLTILEENAHHHTPNEDNHTAEGFPRYRVVFQSTDNQAEEHAPRRKEGNSLPSTGLQSPEHTTSSDLTPLASSPVVSQFQVSPIISPDLDELPDAHLAESSDEAETTPERVHSMIPRMQTPPPVIPAANQKKQRQPPSLLPPMASTADMPSQSSRKRPPPKITQYNSSGSEKAEKKGSLRRAFKKGAASGTNLANLWNKENAHTQQPPKSKSQRPPWGSNKATTGKSNSYLPVPARGSNVITNKDLPQAPQRGNPNYFSSKDLGTMEIPRSSSRASFYSIHERKTSTTDTYSLHSVEQNRPRSPIEARSKLRANPLTRTKPDLDITDDSAHLQMLKKHGRSKSAVPSIYTLRTNNSETSLVLAQPLVKSALEDPMAVMTLNRTGVVTGIFPRAHFVHNITRFVRFSSASYGSSFLKVMGIAAKEHQQNIRREIIHHQEHHSFSKHTGLPPSAILLSSFIDPQGGTNAAGETDTGVPLIHFVALDHQSKAVVLTCRGTLGFEDVLTDLTCDYDDLVWRGKTYKVHKGMHASARRLLEGSGGKLMATIRAALEEYPDYGLVMCGHSLGGGVTSILALLISEPSFDNPSNPTFITATSSPKTPFLLTSGQTGSVPPTPIGLPSGRPIHVYAYGPPATISPSLRRASRGLITTVINGQDLVPFLSLGVIRDLQAIALAFKTDTSGAKKEVRKRIWDGLTSGLGSSRSTPTGGIINEEEDFWAYAALKNLRASMLAPKLMPPGEVFVVETMPVLQRDAFTTGENSELGGAKLGRPATRVVLKYVRDVEGRFGEVRFGASMLGDHSPGRYELGLAALARGILD